MNEDERNGRGWTQIVEGFTPKPEEEKIWWTGNQVFNFFPCDKDYRNNPKSRACVEKHFTNAVPLKNDAAMIKFASDAVKLDGAYLEMGVGSGKSINFIAALNPEKKIYGFDSFEGLPEDWQRRDVAIPKGSFKLRSEFVFPPVLHNVRLLKGMFSETLPYFKKQVLQDKPIAFIHVDCDLYVSAKDVFDHIGDRIVSGTVLLFDEFYNYDEYDNDEFRAFNEFLEASGKKAKYIAFNQFWEQAAAVIL
jgi:hypothetical protein